MTTLLYNALIRAHLNLGQAQETILLFTHMLAHQAPPNNYTFPSLIKAASSAPSLASLIGIPIHTQVIRRGVLRDPFVQTSFVSFYAQRGKLSHARRVFEEITQPCIVSYILDALGKNGDMGSAVLLFKCMPERVVISWTSIINGFGRNGYFEHFGCVVDLLGRAGFLREATELIKSMPFEPDATVLGALLGACKVHGAIELGNEVGRRLLELQPWRCGRYVVLSNIYAGAERWGHAADLRKTMVEAGIQKILAYSLIDSM